MEKLEDIRVCYFEDLLRWDTQRRKEILKKRSFVDCDCSKCQDPESDKLTSAIKCPKCTGCVPKADGKYLYCLLYLLNKAIRTFVYNS